MVRSAGKTNPLIWDVVKEVANVGVGGALMSFSSILSGSVLDMGLPRLLTGADLEKIAQDKLANWVSVGLGFHGGTSGTFLIVLHHSQAKALCAALLGKEGDSPRLGSMEESALLEVGNILACAFLDAISKLAGGVMLPTTPEIRHGTQQELVGWYLRSHRNPILIELAFAERQKRFAGEMVLIWDEAAAFELGEALGVRSQL